MDGAPDRWADGALRRGAAGERVDVVEAGHVFDGNFDAEVEAFWFAGVDDGDGAVDGGVEGGFEFGEGLVGSIGVGVSMSGSRCFARTGFALLTASGLAKSRGWNFGAAEEARDFFERALRGGKADALEAAAGEMFQALERQRKMRAALGRNEGVNFVEDDGVDGAEEFARLRSEKQVERFGRGDENVGRMAREAGAFGWRECRRCEWRRSVRDMRWPRRCAACAMPTSGARRLRSTSTARALIGEI